MIREVVESGQPHDEEVRDLEGRWYSLRVYPYRVAGQKVKGAVIVMVDIDSHKRAEESLREADRRKDEFLATLAHELRNPLAPIRNAVEILRLAAADSTLAVQAREVLFRQVNQMSRIVEDLIDVSRVVEKKVELKTTRLNLADPIHAAIETCRSYVESCRHQIMLSLPADPLEFDGDPERLTQVLINLLNNAAKYTEPGGLIFVTAEPEGPGWIALRIRDTGIGIDAALLPHIFEMFTQGRGAPDHGRGGLGVGLALARSLVQLHHGTLEAFSDGPGQGSEFLMRLPAAKRRLPLPEKTRATGSMEIGAVPPRRILVIDDNRDQTESLGLLLGLMGHHVRVEYDGPAGLAAAAEFVPDVALIDIGLPGLSGLDVARRIRDDLQLRNVLLVAQTGWGQESDRQRSLEAGFDHHLVKPVDLATFQRLLGGREADSDSP